MIRAVIVDDESHCIDRLKKLLRDYCSNEVIVIGCASDIETGYAAINTHKPDVVFLDIQINQQTGFDLLKKFADIDFEVVFITAFEQYAMQAIKFSALDYLLKPIDPDDLIETVQKFEKRTTGKITTEKIQVFFENMANLKGNTKKIVVPVQNELLFLSVQDIVHCSSDINYTTLYLKDRKSVFVAKTLKEFEVLLTPFNFFRVHNSHLINFNYVKSYHKSGYVVLDDATKIEVSVRRKQAFLEKMASQI